MKPADTGDGKLTPDVVLGDELTNDDLEGVIGGFSPAPDRWENTAEAPPAEIV